MGQKLLFSEYKTGTCKKTLWKLDELSEANFYLIK